MTKRMLKITKRLVQKPVPYQLNYQDILKVLIFLNLYFGLGIKIKGFTSTWVIFVILFNPNLMIAKPTKGWYRKTKLNGLYYKSKAEWVIFQ